ncbi:helicase C-terminal domain-containing protein [Pradoshia sp.]
MKKEYRISIRHLVEYVYRSGDLDNRFRVATSMSEGTRIHQEIQSAYEADDEKEVFLRHQMEEEGITFTLEGRCDGILHRGEEVIIQEIKSTSQDIEVLKETSYPVHWAQAKCYAYIYAVQNNLSSMKVELLYVEKQTKKTASHRRSWTVEELEAFVHEVVHSYLPFVRLQLMRTEEKLATADSVSFPFTGYRDGQRKLMGAAWKTISERKNLFAQAPTGTGKTISFLFPAIKQMGLEAGEQVKKIIYLTGKTTTKKVAESTVRMLVNNGLKVKAVSLTAKDKMCEGPVDEYGRVQCLYEEGHFDRINEAVLDILAHEDIMDKETIQAYSHKHRVCPFEYSIELAYLSDVLICDYNYLFDPGVSLKRLFEEERKGTVLLIDEAHNLVERGREMFSKTLWKKDFLQLQRDFKRANPPLSEAAKAVNRYFIDAKKGMGQARIQVDKEKPEECIRLIEQFMLVMEGELARSGESAAALLDIYFNAQAFLRIAKYYSEAYVTKLFFEQQNMGLKIYCLDPSANLASMSKGFAAKIFFSATFSPAKYYMDALGGDREDYALSVPSPFSDQQLEVQILGLSTKYKDRDRTAESIAAAIRINASDKDNYLVFFPSYQYMLLVTAYLEDLVETHEVLIQSQGMGEDERAAFLYAFEKRQEKPVIGFAVMGGVFSEGIDLIGEALSGVIVIGVGMPQVNEDRNLIKDYYQSLGVNGFDYAYVYPGMNKVMQAGGRLIRTEQDRGKLILIDERFLMKKYQALLPALWTTCLKRNEQ